MGRGWWYESSVRLLNSERTGKIEECSSTTETVCAVGGSSGTGKVVFRRFEG